MRWSVVALGSLLLLGSGAYVVLDSEGPLIDTAEVVLPVLCGVAIVGYGYWLRNGEYTDAHVATIALGQVLGGLCFAALVGWIVVIQTLDGDVSPEPGYTLLNGVAIGTVVSGVVTAEYLLVRHEQRHVRRQNERLESFASMASHDLRNPLNVAAGRVEMARERRDSDDLAAASRAHERMNTMIDDLLELAREGNEVDEVAPVDIETVVDRCWHHVDTGGAILEIDAEGTIMADRSRLEQLLENLVRNAVEHSSTSSQSKTDDAVEHDRANVTVTVGRTDEGFYVADDGPGIPPNERADVFDMGYSTTNGGTGLGLTIVEEVAAGHGWTVSVTEGADGGARFDVGGATWRPE